MRMIIENRREGMKTLDQLTPGEIAIITRIAGEGGVKRRIVDMGLVTGAKVRMQKLAPLGDPMEIKVKNFNLSLRKNEAKMIEVVLAETI